MTEEDRSAQDKFRLQGVFMAGSGDMVVDVCAEILGMSFVVIASGKEMDIIIRFPHKRMLSTDPVYLAYYVSGPGHYDATSIMISTMQQEPDVVQP